MRLGITGMMPGKVEDIDANLVKKIAELGFTGVGMHLVGDPQAVTDEAVQQARSLLAEHNIGLIQFWGWYPSLLTPDDATRAEGVRTAQNIIRLASKLGAEMVGIRPTSLNPRGVWWPHKDNFAPATEDRLVDSLTEIAQASADTGVPIALECHTVSTLRDAKSVRRIIERTQSPWVKYNLDPVNFVADLNMAYDTTSLLNEIFDELGAYIAAAHIKDVYVEDRHVVHISETIPGDGIFDFDTLFRRFEALLPNGYGFIEHLPEAQIPQAKAFVSAKLKELQIRVI